MKKSAVSLMVSHLLQCRMPTVPDSSPSLHHRRHPLATITVVMTITVVITITVVTIPPLRIGTKAARRPIFALRKRSIYLGVRCAPVSRVIACRNNAALLPQWFMPSRGKQMQMIDRFGVAVGGDTVMFW